MSTCLTFLILKGSLNDVERDEDITIIYNHNHNGSVTTVRLSKTETNSNVFIAHYAIRRHVPSETSTDWAATELNANMLTIRTIVKRAIAY